MSKKPRKARRPCRQRCIFGGYVEPRTDEVIQREVMEAVDTGDYEHLPAEIVRGFTYDKVWLNDVKISGHYEWAESDIDQCSMSGMAFAKVVRRAMAAGFVAALVKYRKELAAVPALSRFYSRGDSGRRVSRNNQTKRKQTRAAEALALTKAGHTVAEIVGHFRANGMPKCNRTTVYRWLKVKSRAR